MLHALRCSARLCSAERSNWHSFIPYFPFFIFIPHPRTKYIHFVQTTTFCSALLWCSLCACNVTLKPMRMYTKYESLRPATSSELTQQPSYVPWYTIRIRDTRECNVWWLRVSKLELPAFRLSPTILWCWCCLSLCSQFSRTGSDSNVLAAAAAGRQAVTGFV
jgi:hypothetical protein